MKHDNQKYAPPHSNKKSSFTLAANCKITTIANLKVSLKNKNVFCLSVDEERGERRPCSYRVVVTTAMIDGNI